MEIILLCLYGKVTVIVIFLIIYLYWIWKKVRLIKWEQAPGDTRDWIRNHEKNINKIIKIISGIGLIFMVYCIVIPAILDIPTLVKQEYTVTEGIVESWNYSDEERLEERSISIKDDTGQEKSVIVYHLQFDLAGCHTEIQKLLPFRSCGATAQRHGLPGTRSVYYYTEAVSGASEKNCLSQEAYPA